MQSKSHPYPNQFLSNSSSIQMRSRSDTNPNLINCISNLNPKPIQIKSKPNVESIKIDFESKLNPYLIQIQSNSNEISIQHKS